MKKNLNRKDSKSPGQNTSIRENSHSVDNRGKGNNNSIYLENIKQVNQKDFNGKKTSCNDLIFISTDKNKDLNAKKNIIASNVNQSLSNQASFINNVNSPGGNGKIKNDYIPRKKRK